MKPCGYWKRFEATGQIDDYLHYKNEQNQSLEEDVTDADHNNGAGIASDQNGRG